MGKKEKRELEKFLSKFDLDGKVVAGLGELGVEKKEDLQYLTEEVGRACNPSWDPAHLD